VRRTESRAERQPPANDGEINVPGPAVAINTIVTRRGGDGRPIALHSGGAQYRSLLSDAIFRAIRGQIENTGDSDTGAHVNEIVASLRTDGFPEHEVRIALVNLRAEGIVYNTVDEHHYNLAADESTGRESTRYAYGSSLNDMIIRALRDLGAQAEDGVYFLDLVAELSLEGYHQRDYEAALNVLLNEGHVYTTIDDDHFQWSEYPPHDSTRTNRRSLFDD